MFSGWGVDRGIAFLMFAVLTGMVLRFHCVFSDWGVDPPAFCRWTGAERERERDRERERERERERKKEGEREI